MFQEAALIVKTDTIKLRLRGSKELKCQLNFKSNRTLKKIPLSKYMQPCPDVFRLGVRCRVISPFITMHPPLSNSAAEGSDLNEQLNDLHCFQRVNGQVNVCDVMFCTL